MNKVALSAVSLSLLALAACNGAASVTPDTETGSSSSSMMMEASSAMMDDSSAMSADSSSSSSSSVEGMTMSAAATVEVIAQ